MLYYLLRPIVAIALRVYYKKVSIKNPERLNLKQPVLIISNHTSAFMDAVAIAILANKKIYSVARGDVFNTSLKRRLLGQLAMLPIYRREEGTEHMHKNDDTFEQVMQLMEKKQSLLIFPEGNCVQERRIRKLRKGTARMGLGAEERNDFKLGCLILPVGIHYSRARKFRGTLFVNVGEPIHVNAYKEMYRADKVKAINVFTQDMENALKSLTVAVRHRPNDKLYDELTEMKDAEDRNRLLKLSYGYKQDVEIAENINFFEEKQPELFERFRTQVHHYMKALRALGLRDHLLQKNNIQKITTWFVLRDVFLLMLGLPLYLAGVLINYLPYKLALIAANKLVKHEEFYASVHFGISMFGWMVYYVFQLIITGLVFQSITALIFSMLLIPLMGWYCLRFYPFLKKATGRFRLLTLVANNKKQAQHLIYEREEITNLFNQMRGK